MNRGRGFTTSPHTRLCSQPEQIYMLKLQPCLSVVHDPVSSIAAGCSSNGKSMSLPVLLFHCDASRPTRWNRHASILSFLITGRCRTVISSIILAPPRTNSSAWLHRVPWWRRVSSHGDISPTPGFQALISENAESLSEPPPLIYHSGQAVPCER